MAICQSFGDEETEKQQAPCPDMVRNWCNCRLDLFLIRQKMLESNSLKSVLLHLQVLFLVIINFLQVFLKDWSHIQDVFQLCVRFFAARPRASKSSSITSSAPCCCWASSRIVWAPFEHEEIGHADDEGTTASNCKLFAFATWETTSLVVLLRLHQWGKSTGSTIYNRSWAHPSCPRNLQKTRFSSTSVFSLSEQAEAKSTKEHKVNLRMTKGPNWPHAPIIALSLVFWSPLRT